ncbi:MAG: DUF1571 domain-containing protein [Deltaproteobacteria bacterium]|nr:DUF1571 domain-containing protein [Deltaproteobacteria bacterium]
MRVILLGLTLLLFLPPASGLAQNGKEVDQLAEVLKVLAQCREAYYRLDDYRGTVLHIVREADGETREERIEVAFRKPGFLSFRWESGLHKGTALLARPRWNQGNLMLRLGGWFDFLTISVPATELGEPFQPAVRDMSDWLTALAALAQRPVTDRSLRMVEVQMVAPYLAEGKMRLSVPAFLIPFRDNMVSTYEFIIERGTGIPTELTLRGVGGEARQQVLYTNLQVNVGLPTQLFSWEPTGEEPPSVTPSGTTIDLPSFTQYWQRRYAEITDYSGTWAATTGGEGTEQRMRAAFKFRKPFDLYLQWEPGQGRFQEALLRRGWNDGRVRVRQTTWGVPLIGDLVPDDVLPRWGETLSLTAFGIHGLVERLQAQLLRGWLRAELQTRFLGVQRHEGRWCYVVAFEFSTGPGQEYPAARIVTTWDIVERLLVKYESFATSEREASIQERHEFLGVRINTALRDDDFDAANPAYGFLLLRRTPWIDRFLTGRD